MNALKIALATTAALSVAAPAFAQYQPTDQYRQDMRNYQADRAEYQDRQADYASARADYEARRDRYERDRARYDARYGYGAYARIYGPAPAWDSAYWDRGAPSYGADTAYRAGYSDAHRDFDRRLADYDRARASYDARYGYGAYARRYGAAPVWSGEPYDAGAYGRDTAYTGTDPCYRSTSRDTGTGAVIGALAGAALGSNVAAHGRKTEGTVLGALVGAGIGGAVGNAHAKAANARCDQAGLYFNYADTVPYRESSWDRQARASQYDYNYYMRRGCRLAPAPVDVNGDQDYRYVRVCPDGDGRYRVTG